MVEYTNNPDKNKYFKYIPWRHNTCQFRPRQNRDIKILLKATALYIFVRMLELFTPDNKVQQYKENNEYIKADTTIQIKREDAYNINQRIQPVIITDRQYLHVYLETDKTTKHHNSLLETNTDSAKIKTCLNKTDTIDTLISLQIDN